MKVLIIEDHPRIRENIVAFFQMQLHTADSAKNGEEGLQKALVNKYDILLLDMAMPIMSGQCFLEELRKQNNMTPVLVMTSNSLLEDKETMYALGADDFIVKPFELKELLMRSIAINRRQGGMVEKEVQVNDVTIHLDKMQITRNDIPINLPAKELKILVYLAVNKEVPKSKSEILQYVWGEKEENLLLNTMTLEVHIANIRKKIGKESIKTVRSIGYILVTK